MTAVSLRSTIPLARVLAQIAAWRTGPDRVVADAPYFSASGNRLLLEGYLIASFVPDWMCNIWRHEIPQLAGKVKLMPLPAWERGGRRTSVWGGTMLGISRAAPNSDELWPMAKHLYLSPELARELYAKGDIVTPVRTLWSDPIFDQPDPFFSNQPKGRMYIELAQHVPIRTSSPYGYLAMVRVQTALVALVRYAQRNECHTLDQLLPLAGRLLREAQEEIAAQVRRNVFLRESAAGDVSGAAGGAP